MAEQRTITPNEDPVCGMPVDPRQARIKGLVKNHREREYLFCGRGCLLEFQDDPERFLAKGYVPEM